MSKRSLALTVMTAMVAVACGGSSKKPAPVAPPPGPVAPPPAPAPPLAVVPPAPALPAIPSTPAPAPAELIVTAVTPAPVTLAPMLSSYLEHAVPGLGQEVSVDALIAAASADGVDLRGIDFGRPMWVLMLDPARFHQPFVLVAGVGDEGALAAQVKEHDARYQTHNGFAAIGTTDALTAAGGYALTTLIDAPMPARPTVDVDVHYVMLHDGSMLEGLLMDGAAAQAPQGREAYQFVMHGMTSMLGQLDHVRVTFELAGSDASTTVTLHPRPGTAVASFVAQQVPATFVQLERLPAGGMTMGGRLVLGSLVTDLIDSVAPMFKGIYGDSAATQLAIVRQWVDVGVGEVGATAARGAGGMTMAMLTEVADPATVARLWTESLAAQVKATTGVFTMTAKTSSYRGSKLWSTVTTIRPDAPGELGAPTPFGTASSSVFAIVDRTVVMAMAPDAMVRARAMIDGLRAAAKKPRPAVASLVSPVLAEARRRRESGLITMDFPTLMAWGQASTPDARVATPVAAPSIPPVVLALGADGGALTLRLTVPSAQVGEVVRSEQAKAAATDAQVDAALATVEQVADQVCHCPDAACASKAMAQIATLKQPSRKPTEAELTRAMAIAARAQECQKKLNPPPTPAPAP